MGYSQFNTTISSYFLTTPVNTALQPAPVVEPQQPQIADLFSGASGFSCGFKMKDFWESFAVEHNQMATFPYQVECFSGDSLVYH